MGSDVWSFPMSGPIERLVYSGQMFATAVSFAFLLLAAFGAFQ